MLELGLLTGHLSAGRTLHSSSSAVIITATSFPASLRSLQVQDLNNYLTAAVLRIDLAENFQTQFSSTPSSPLQPFISIQKLNTTEEALSRSKSPRAAAVSVSADQEQTSPLSRREIKVPLPSSSPSPCQRLRRERRLPPAAGRLSPPERGSCKTDSSLFVSIHN